MTNNDQRTADSFANSWNNLPDGSVYTYSQFEEWFAPLNELDVKNKNVLELGCGNASLMVHLTKWNPQSITGVDLGDSVTSANGNMRKTNFKNWRILKGDLVTYRENGYDVVYSIGVLHHLKSPKSGFDSVVANTMPGGKFHCWVYAHEGNGIIIYFLDPLRKIVSRCPWWFTKYFVATPLAVPFYIYAKILEKLSSIRASQKFPLYHYCQWIAKREFSFFRHVAFDQLVTPQTTYIKKAVIEEWLMSQNNIEKDSIYIIFRNGNSWKFGGRTT